MTTRHSWIARCAHRYIDALGLNPNDALACAYECATAQDDLHGSRSSEWGLPSEVADIDMACWETELS